MNDPLAPWTESLFHWLAAWTTVVLLVTAWLLLLRPKRAAVRYGAWLLATFSGAVLLPVMIAMAPVVSWDSAMDLLAHHTSSPSEAPIAFRSWFDNRAQQSEVLPQPTTDATDAATSVPAGSAPQPTLPAATPPAPVPGQSTIQQSNWLPWAALIWSLGLIAFLARLAVAFLRTRRLVAAAVPTNAGPARVSPSAPPVNKGGPGGVSVGDQLTTTFDAARRQLHVRRPVRLAVHPDLPTPVCTGLLRPTVLWPHCWIDSVSPAHQLAAMVRPFRLTRVERWSGGSHLLISPRSPYRRFGALW